MAYCLTFLIVFILGEYTVNKWWFPWLKRTIAPEVQDDDGAQVKWMGLPPSVFKGVLERLIITISLLAGIPSILIVFGTLKLGTRLSDNKEMKNDYFLVGNLSTILFSVVYVLLIIECSTQF